MVPKYYSDLLKLGPEPKINRKSHINFTHWKAGYFAENSVGKEVL